MKDLKDLYITDGTAQHGRRSPVLTGEQFNVDELSFEALLAMGAEFAAKIDFYNLKNEKIGHWGDLFEADEAVIMAMIVGTDLQILESNFLKIPPDKLIDRTEILYGLATKVNTCFTRLNVCHNKTGELLALKISSIIDQKLSIELHNLGRTMNYIASYSKNYEYPEFSIFHSVWGIADSGAEDQFPKSNFSDFEQPEKLSRHLTASFYIYITAISHLKATTDSFLEKSMLSQQHNPAIGLFMVFLKLYGKAQNKLNKFTSRHLDFYYDRVLGTKKRDQVAEKYYLLFETLPGTKKSSIDKGTEFSAGKNSELGEIIYSSDEAAVVTDATISSLATLYLQRDKLVSPENEFGYVTRMKADFPEMPELNDGGNESSISWPLFGAEKQGAMKSISTDARIGFCIASPVLLLEQGDRKIEIAIEFDVDLDAQLKSLKKTNLETLEELNNKRLSVQADERRAKQIKHLLIAHCLLGINNNDTQKKVERIISEAEALLPGELLEDIKQLLMKGKDDWKELFYRLSKELFSIELTVESGWLSVHNYTVVPYDKTQQKLGLRILFNLGQEIEAVTNYLPEPHGGNFDTELPVLQCVINPLTNFYSYSLFQNLPVKSFQIDVAVKGIKNLLLHNQHGQLDPSKPFQPFGPLPGSNSYVVFGNYEIARKQLVALTINLEWTELPIDINGFEDYYQGYQASYTNHSFKGKLTVLLDGSWQPRDTRTMPGFCLFDSEKGGGKLASFNAISITNPYYAKPIATSISEQGFGFGLNARNGFFRMTLDEPKAAFAHAEYPHILTKVLTENAKKKKPNPLPNPPYTPTLNAISLDYSASSKINISAGIDVGNRYFEKMIHLHPFGFETVYPASVDKPCYLMPQYTSEGNLFIGVSATNISDTLILFFDINEEFEQEIIAIDTEFEWFYLRSNIWESIAPERVLSDTTSGFLSSGRVKLDIPKDINRENSIMPGNFYWLRVSSKYRLGALHGCHSVQVHAVEVSKKIEKFPNQDVEPGEVTGWRPTKSIVGINGIKQDYKAFGGRARESESNKKRRISERLRHKNRALLPWDYEHLVLEKFPDIYKVKCFPNMSAVENCIRPGRVLIVVVSDSQLSTGAAASKAMVNPKQLDHIKTSLLGLCSPFAALEVRNPVYELVQVRCTVCFADSSSEGANIKRLNQHISDYISPWKKVGYKGRFGWVIRQQDIESYIRSLSYIKHVTNFSMLHITVDNEENYSLFDTVNESQDSEGIIKPCYPWSLVLPMKNHFIETIQKPGSIEALKTGIDELAIGGTLIIGGNN